MRTSRTRGSCLATSPRCGSRETTPETTLETARPAEVTVAWPSRSAGKSEVAFAVMMLPSAAP
eukprot:5029417-Prymnesium_polylepis.1